MSAFLFCAMLAMQAPDDAAATKALDAFQSTWTKEKTSDARVNAVGELAKTPHDKVCAKLATLLTNEDKKVREAAANGMATFKDPAELRKAAGQKLAGALTAGTNANDPDTKVTLLNALGTLQEESVANKVKDLFDDKDNKVAAAAITNAGLLRNKNMVDPLISVFKDCEEKIKEMSNQAPPPQQKATKKGGASGAPPPANNDAEKKRERTNTLMGAAQTALGTLTGISFKTCKEYQDWWAKNRGSFQPK